MTGCPRIDVYTTAVQLLQVLDKRFFGNVGPLQNECDKGKLSISSFPLSLPRSIRVIAWLAVVANARLGIRQTIFLARN